MAHLSKWKPKSCWMAHCKRKKISEWRKGIRMTKTAPPPKLQESRSMAKLCHCWKDLWPTQHRPGTKFDWSLECCMSWLLRSLPWLFSCATTCFSSSQLCLTPPPLLRLLLPHASSPLPRGSLGATDDLCYCVFDSGKQNIRRQDSEATFKDLARILLHPSVLFLRACQCIHTDSKTK